MCDHVEEGGDRKLIAVGRGPWWSPQSASPGAAAQPASHRPAFPVIRPSATQPARQSASDLRPVSTCCTNFQEIEEIKVTNL